MIHEVFRFFGMHLSISFFPFPFPDDGSEPNARRAARAESGGYERGLLGYSFTGIPPPPEGRAARRRSRATGDGGMNAMGRI